MDNLITLTGINITVPRNENIIIDSLSVNVGDVIQIIAPSGRGKSFFYHTLLGLTVESKKLNLASNLFSYSPAYLPFFSATVEDELKRVNSDMDKLPFIINEGIIDPEFLTLSCQNLSSGQNQILIFLRAILSDRPILIFDELMNAMDPELKEKIASYITCHELNSRAIIFSLHDSFFLSVSKLYNL